jgi:hypothetical protein
MALYLEDGLPATWAVSQLHVIDVDLTIAVAFHDDCYLDLKRE